MCPMKDYRKTPLFVGVSVDTRQQWRELLEFSRFNGNDFLTLLLNLYENLDEQPRGEVVEPRTPKYTLPPRALFDKIMLRVDQGGPMVDGAPHLGQCWMWTGAANEKGHGLIRAEGRNIRVHRAMWEHMNGPIPPDHLVLHRCFRMLCVRPEHLVLVEKHAVVSEALQTSYRTWSS